MKANFITKSLLANLLLFFSLVLSGCAKTLDPVQNVNQKRTSVVGVNGSKISYRDFGQGKPLILLQRFRGSLHDWDPELLQSLAKTNRVIIFDSVGVGESEGVIPDTLEGAADFVVNFMDALNVEKANILGWSLGGMTAQILAIKHPNRVQKLILAGTTSPAVNRDVKLAPDEWTAIATKPENSAADMAYLFYTTTGSGIRAARDSRLRFERVHHLGVETKTSPKIMIPQAIGARKFMANEGLWYEQLSKIDSPVLVANGDSDLAFPLRNSVDLHQQLPNSKLAIYPDAGHAFLFQYARQFAEHVDDFLHSD